MKTQHQTRYRSGWHSSFSFKYLNSSEKPRYDVQYEEDTHYINCRMQCWFFLLSSWSRTSDRIWFECWVICHLLLHRCCSLSGGLAFHFCNWDGSYLSLSDFLFNWWHNMLLCLDKFCINDCFIFARFCYYNWFLHFYRHRGDYFGYWVIYSFLHHRKLHL